MALPKIMMTTSDATIELSDIPETTGAATYITLMLKSTPSTASQWLAWAGLSIAACAGGFWFYQYLFDDKSPVRVKDSQENKSTSNQNGWASNQKDQKDQKGYEQGYEEGYEEGYEQYEHEWIFNQNELAISKKDQPSDQN